MYNRNLFTHSSWFMVFIGSCALVGEFDYASTNSAQVRNHPSERRSWAGRNC